MTLGRVATLFVLGLCVLSLGFGFAHALSNEIQESNLACTDPKDPYIYRLDKPHNGPFVENGKIYLNLYGKPCKDTQGETVTATGYCVAPKTCKATKCAGETCKKPEIPITQPGQGEPAQPATQPGQTGTQPPDVSQIKPDPNTTKSINDAFNPLDPNPLGTPSSFEPKKADSADAIDRFIKDTEGAQPTNGNVVNTVKSEFKDFRDFISGESSTLAPPTGESGEKGSWQPGVNDQSTFGDTRSQTRGIEQLRTAVETAAQAEPLQQLTAADQRLRTAQEAIDGSAETIYEKQTAVDQRRAAFEDATRVTGATFDENTKQWKLPPSATKTDYDAFRNAAQNYKQAIDTYTSDNDVTNYQAARDEYLKTLEAAKPALAEYQKAVSEYNSAAELQQLTQRQYIDSLEAPQDMVAANLRAQADATQARIEAMQKAQRDAVAGATYGFGFGLTCPGLCHYVNENGTSVKMSDYLSRTDAVISAERTELSRLNRLADFFSSSDPLAAQVASTPLEGPRAALVQHHLDEMITARQAADQFASPFNVEQIGPNHAQVLATEKQAAIERLMSGGELTAAERSFIYPSTLPTESVDLQMKRDRLAASNLSTVLPVVPIYDAVRLTTSPTSGQLRELAFMTGSQQSQALAQAWTSAGFRTALTAAEIVSFTPVGARAIGAALDLVTPEVVTRSLSRGLGSAWEGFATVAPDVAGVVRGWAQSAGLEGNVATFGSLRPFQPAFVDDLDNFGSRLVTPYLETEQAAFAKVVREGGDAFAAQETAYQNLYKNLQATDLAYTPRVQEVLTGLRTEMESLGMQPSVNAEVLAKMRTLDPSIPLPQNRSLVLYEPPPATSVATEVPALPTPRPIDSLPVSPAEAAPALPPPRFVEARPVTEVSAFTPTQAQMYEISRPLVPADVAPTAREISAIQNYNRALDVYSTAQIRAESGTLGETSPLFNNARDQYFAASRELDELRLFQRPAPYADDSITTDRIYRANTGEVVAERPSSYGVAAAERPFQILSESKALGTTLEPVSSIPSVRTLGPVETALPGSNLGASTRQTFSMGAELFSPKPLVETPSVLVMERPAFRDTLSELFNPNSLPVATEKAFITRAEKSAVDYLSAIDGTLADLRLKGISPSTPLVNSYSRDLVTATGELRDLGFSIEPTTGTIYKGDAVVAVKAPVVFPGQSPYLIVADVEPLAASPVIPVQSEQLPDLTRDLMPFDPAFAVGPVESAPLPDITPAVAVSDPALLTPEDVVVQQPQSERSPALPGPLARAWDTVTDLLSVGGARANPLAPQVLDDVTRFDTALLPSESPIERLSVARASELSPEFSYQPTSPINTVMYRGIGAEYNPSYLGDPYFTPDYKEALYYATRNAGNGDPHILIAEVPYRTVLDLQAYRDLESLAGSRALGLGEISSGYVQFPQEWFDPNASAQPLAQKISGLDQRKRALTDESHAAAIDAMQRTAAAEIQAQERVARIDPDRWQRLSELERQEVARSDPEAIALRAEFERLWDERDNVARELARTVVTEAPPVGRAAPITAEEVWQKIESYTGLADVGRLPIAKRAAPVALAVGISLAPVPAQGAAIQDILTQSVAPARLVLPYSDESLVPPSDLERALGLLQENVPQLANASGNLPVPVVSPAERLMKSVRDAVSAYRMPEDVVELYVHKLAIETIDLSQGTVSWANARGIGQVTPSAVGQLKRPTTPQFVRDYINFKYGSVTNAWNLVKQGGAQGALASVDLGIGYVAYLYHYEGLRGEGILAGYNGGPKRGHTLANNPFDNNGLHTLTGLPKETQNYIRTIRTNITRVRNGDAPLAQGGSEKKGPALTAFLAEFRNRLSPIRPNLAVASAPRTNVSTFAAQNVPLPAARPADAPTVVAEAPITGPTSPTIPSVTAEVPTVVAQEVVTPAAEVPTQVAEAPTVVSPAPEVTPVAPPELAEIVPAEWTNPVTVASAPPVVEVPLPTPAPTRSVAQSEPTATQPVTVASLEDRVAQLETELATAKGDVALMRTSLNTIRAARNNIERHVANAQANQGDTGLALDHTRRAISAGASLSGSVNAIANLTGNTGLANTAKALASQRLAVAQQVNKAIATYKTTQSKLALIPYAGLQQSIPKLLEDANALMTRAESAAQSGLTALQQKERTVIAQLESANVQLAEAKIPVPEPTVVAVAPQSEPIVVAETRVPIQEAPAVAAEVPEPAVVAAAPPTTVASSPTALTVSTYVPPAPLIVRYSIQQSLYAPTPNIPTLHAKINLALRPEEPRVIAGRGGAPQPTPSREPLPPAPSQSAIIANRSAVFSDPVVDSQSFVEFPRLPLSGQEGVMQEAAIAKYLSQKDTLIRQYESHFGTKLVNPDLARLLFRDIGYRGTNSSGVQTVVADMTEELWKRALTQNPEEKVILYTGSAGAGKSSAVEGILPEIHSEAAVILDGTLSSPAVAESRISDALAAGKEVEVINIYRDPLDAWQNGVISRMNDASSIDAGRVVPVSAFVVGYKRSLDVVKSLLAEPREGVHVSLIDNSRGAGNARLMQPDEFLGIRYAKSTERAIRDTTLRMLERGQITPQQYAAITGSEAPVKLATAISEPVAPIDIDVAPQVTASEPPAVVRQQEDLRAAFEQPSVQPSDVDVDGAARLEAVAAEIRSLYEQLPAPKNVAYDLPAVPSIEAEAIARVETVAAELRSLIPESVPEPVAAQMEESVLQQAVNDEIAAFERAMTNLPDGFLAAYEATLLKNIARINENDRLIAAQPTQLPSRVLANLERELDDALARVNDETRVQAILNAVREAPLGLPAPTGERSFTTIESPWAPTPNMNRASPPEVIALPGPEAEVPQWYLDWYEFSKEAELGPLFHLQTIARGPAPQVAINAAPVIPQDRPVAQPTTNAVQLELPLEGGQMGAPETPVVQPEYVQGELFPAETGTIAQATTPPPATRPVSQIIPATPASETPTPTTGGGGGTTPPAAPPGGGGSGGSGGGTPPGDGSPQGDSSNWAKSVGSGTWKTAKFLCLGGWKRFAACTAVGGYGIYALSSDGTRSSSQPAGQKQPTPGQATQPPASAKRPADGKPVAGEKYDVATYCVESVSPRVIVRTVPAGTPFPANCLNGKGAQPPGQPGQQPGGQPGQQPGSGWCMVQANPVIWRQCGQNRGASSLGGLLGKMLSGLNGSQSSGGASSATGGMPTSTSTPSATTTLSAAVALVANPDAVALNATTTLWWTSVRTSGCAIYAPGDVLLASSTPSGSTSTPQIATTTVFMARCDVPSGSQVQATTTVTVVE